MGKRVNDIGVVSMNKEFKYNILSKAFIDEITRSLMTLEVEEGTKFVFLDSYHGEVLSHGTDVRRKIVLTLALYFMRKNDEISKIDDYLQSLYNLQTFIAGYHKPLISIASGKISKCFYSLRLIIQFNFLISKYLKALVCLLLLNIN